MRVLHSSDLHGNWKQLLAFQDFDVWVDSGDFFPNKTRGTPEEKRYQTRWFANKRVGERLTKWLDGRPLISVPGNHDYTSLPLLMREAGAETFPITPEGVTVYGIRYAGFREVPFIEGEWAGEIPQGAFRDLVWRTFRNRPHVLVTHAGPGSILSGGDSYHCGIDSLVGRLAYQPHDVRAHFFGHDHDYGSQTLTELGVLFSNSATKPKIITVPGLAVNNPRKKKKKPQKRRSVVHEVHILKTPKAGAHTTKSGKKGYKRRKKHQKKEALYNPSEEAGIYLLSSATRGATLSGLDELHFADYRLKRTDYGPAMFVDWAKTAKRALAALKRLGAADDLIIYAVGELKGEHKDLSLPELKKMAAYANP
tara:strand:+ start:825 stop:1922 length:1098 start_codon:yes stop_codon:yes gene_type:complete